MGSLPAPHLANGWMSQFDAHIKGESNLHFRYMDDILKKSKTHRRDQELHDINKLHRSLTFTRERENDGSLPMLDMSIMNEGGNPLQLNIVTVFLIVRKWKLVNVTEFTTLF